jgi:cyanate permease
MGLNAFLYHILVGWLPPVLIDAGYSAAQASSLHGVMQLAAAAPGFVLGPARRPHQGTERHRRRRSQMFLQPGGVGVR